LCAGLAARAARLAISHAVGMLGRMISNLEAYEAERADFERVLEAVRRVQAAASEELQSEEWLVDVIRHAGLVPIPECEKTYGPEAEYLNSSQQGLIQIPHEFARYLKLLGEHAPSSYLEIGCFNGATASLATAYLHRFNPALYAVAIDIFPGFVFYPEVKDLIPLRYEVGETSYDLRDHHFDAVFVDGDHSFEWAWADYQNCGQFARVCAMHDVNNAPYRDLHMGGVPAVWELLKQREPQSRFKEIFAHPEGGQYMGIGVRLK
jgi:SAM-dependent methyltransferase